MGVPGWAWSKFAGFVLAASGLGLAALYSTGLRTDVPHLRDVPAPDGTRSGGNGLARRLLVGTPAPISLNRLI